MLSGFLIGGILLDTKGSPGYYRRFYGRRARRILPLDRVLLAAYASAILSGAAGLSSWLFGDPIPHWTFPVFLQNFAMAASGGWGGNWLGVTWSLAVEEQVDLVLPQIVALCGRRVPASGLLVVILSAP